MCSKRQKTNIPEPNPDEITVDICGDHICRKVRYPSLVNEIEEKCDVPAGGEIDGKVIDIGTQQVHIRCTQCMASCAFNGQRGLVHIPKQEHKITAIESLPQLEEQITKMQDGSWEFEDYN